MFPRPKDELQDESVSALLNTTRMLVKQAHRLSVSINDTVDELLEFASDLRRPDSERRVKQQDYEGEDRRDH